MVVEAALVQQFAEASFCGVYLDSKKVSITPRGRGAIVGVLTNEVRFDVLCRGQSYYMAAISRDGDRVMFPSCRGWLSTLSGGTVFRGWHARTMLNLDAFRDRRAAKSQKTALILKTELESAPVDEDAITDALGRSGGGLF